MKFIKTEKGMTMIYLMAAMLITGFIGVSVMNLSHHDVKSSVDYSVMTTAYFSANSALQIAERFIEDSSDSMAKFLTGYVKGRNNGWFIGDSINYISISNSGSPEKVCAKILYFDTANFNAQIEGRGIGLDGTKKTVRGIYNLQGLSKIQDTTPSVMPTKALYLKGGVGEINGAIDIIGNVWVKDTMKFNLSGAIPAWPQSNMFGEFVTGPGTRSMAVENVIFHGPVYTQTPLRFSGFEPIIFKEGLACEKLIKGTGWLERDGTVTPHVLSKGIYLNGGYIYNKKTNCVSNAVARLGGGTPDKAYNCTDKTLQSAKFIDIWDSVGVTDHTEPQALNLNFPAIRAKAITNNTPISAGWVNTLYNNTDTNALYGGRGGFLVIKVNSGPWGEKVASGVPGTFYGKVIFLFDTGFRSSGRNFYNHHDTAITVICVGGGYPMYALTCDNFRGFVYNTSTNMNSWEGSVFKSNGGRFRGGVYCRSTIFRIENTNTTTRNPIIFQFDAGVMAELGRLNFFTKPIITPEDSIIATNINAIQKGIFY